VRCLTCERLSLSLLCKHCLRMLEPSPKKRTLACGLEVISFYAYDDLAHLLGMKHAPYAHHFLKRIATHALTPFAKALPPPKLPLLPIGSYELGAFSHTAILARALRWGYCPYYRALTPNNPVRYAGESLNFRLSNPRNFQLSIPESIHEVVLLDDVLTTGTTLCEASTLLKSKNVMPLYGIVLADGDR